MGRRMGRMKYLKNTGLFLLFIVGFCIFAYPTISDQWNTYRQSLLISNYDRVVSDMTSEDYKMYLEAAKAYNSSMKANSFSGDAFSKTTEELYHTDYWKVLNVNHDGIMGYLSIPKINQRIPIYHGTLDEVLQKGIGHLEGTSLPVGGEGTHAVLSAHRGLPSAKLFTDLDQLEIGDEVYLYILGEKMGYQVDQILPMVDKHDLDTLSGAMQIEDGKDYVTMLTCTPYGVNSHRLLVRAQRMTQLDDETMEETEKTAVQSLRTYYMLYVIIAMAVAIIGFGIMKVIRIFINKSFK